MRPLLLLSSLSFTLVLLASCHKDAPSPSNSNPPAPPGTGASGVYVLSTDGSQTTALSYYNFTTKTFGPDLLRAIDVPRIGYGVVDMVLCGSKIYLADNGIYFRTSCTPQVDVIDIPTGKLIARIPYTGTGAASYPGLGPAGRVNNLTASNGSVFVSNANGSIAEIDTSSLTIRRYAPIGDFAIGGMAVANGQLFCALQDIESDSVAVLDLAAWSLKGQIKVMDEPANMVADPFGNVYAISINDDDAFNIPHVSPDTLGLPDNPSYGGFAVINSLTEAVTSETLSHIDFTPSVAFFRDSLYYMHDNTVRIFNTRTQTAVNSNFVTAGNQNDIAGHLNVNPSTAEVLVAIVGRTPPGQTAPLPAIINVYDAQGKPEYSFQAPLPEVVRTAFR